MEFTDEELARQPIGHWSGSLYRAVSDHIRSALAEQGLTQPQYWILRHLSTGDLSEDGQGRGVAQLTETMRGYLEDGDDIPSEAVALAERGWVHQDAEAKLWITDDGEAARQRVKKFLPQVREAIHEGIDDADYVRALRVFERMLRNIGAEDALR